MATAELFLKNGWSVAICGSSAEKLESCLSSASGDKILRHREDFRAKGAGRKFVDVTLRKFGSIDVLVNCAGVAPMGKLTEISDQEVDDAISINIRAIFETCQQVWTTMAESGGGTIVNISSLAAIDPFEGFSLYGATKSWVDLFSKAIAKEGKPVGISVFSIRPGAIETKMLRDLFPNFPDDQILPPEAVAELIWRLCDPKMKHLSGQAIEIRK